MLKEETLLKKKDYLSKVKGQSIMGTRRDWSQALESHGAMT